MSDLSRADTSFHDMKTWKRVLPTFVEEAQRLSSIKITHNVYDDTVDVQMAFIGRTKNAHKQWNQMLFGGSPPITDAKCDGPCGQHIQDGEVVQFGSCEHNICNGCMERNTRRRPDGIPGCCNENCLKRRSASSSSQLELSTFPSAEISDIVSSEEKLVPRNNYRPNCTVLLYVTMRFILIENKRIVRKSWESEMACTVKMKSLFNKGAHLLGASDPADYDWYLVTKNEEGKHETMKIDLEKSKLLMVGCFSSQADTVDLLAAEKGMRLISTTKNINDAI